MAQITSFFSKGEPRHMLWSAHVVLGGLLLAVLAARIGWRVFWGRVLPHTGAKHLQLVRRLAHAMLYLLLVATVILGAENVWARGWDLFGLLIIPKYDPASTSRALAHSLTGWHGLAANALMVLAGLHACAALIDHYVLQGGALGRMRLIE